MVKERIPLSHCTTFYRPVVKSRSSYLLTPAACLLDPSFT
jgi:hypothetical protein